MFYLRVLSKIDLCGSAMKTLIVIFLTNANPTKIQDLMFVSQLQQRHIVLKYKVIQG